MPVARPQTKKTAKIASPQQMILHTRSTKDFGVRFPIVCAPMGLVTGGRLAAAVTQAQALLSRRGTLDLEGTPPQADRMIR
jgi:NAD(P)H-dependent flavin oxidoreductase YrpB (nitropropane dioxygenase family)